MEKNDLSKKIKNFLKNNIKEIVNNNEEKLDNNSQEFFIKLTKDNINNDKIIKYIIKILSYNIKSSNNNYIQNKNYNLFLLLIKTLSKENIIKYLTSLLIFLQENIDIQPIEIAFEIILKNLKKYELKIFEILNGFCIHNIKNREKIGQNKALLCYEKLINNYQNCIGDKKMILKSFIDNIIFNLKIESFENIYQLMVCLNNIILITQNNFIDYIELTIYYILNNLFMNDNKIRLITLDIINNIIKFNKEKIELFNNEIYKNFKKLLDDKSIDINIKNKIMIILNKLNINIEFDKNNKNKKKEEIKNQKNKDKNYEKVIKINSNELNKKNKDKTFNKFHTQNKELKKENDNIIYKKINKIKPKKIHNRNIKVEIYVKENPKDKLKSSNINRNYTPLNIYNKKIEKNYEFNESKVKKEKFISTYINEDEYINPIKIWYNLDKNSKKNIKNKKIEDSINKISIDKSINNSQITIYNQTKEEPKLDLIMNEIMQISKNQNFLAEKIILLEKNTYNRINLFNEKVNDLEKQVDDNELINYNDNDNNDKCDNIINDKCKVIYPTNSLSGKIIRFLNAKEDENNEEIYLLVNITEEQMVEIDNNLIDEVINKLIDYLNNSIYIHECINFIKKIFVKHKMRFQLNTIKRLLPCLDKLLMNRQILSKEDSLDISLIISSINIDKI